MDEGAEFVDVLIVGAGLSGIGAACHLQRECPDRRVAILEGRQSLGGTWDLFRYPGIRSDSDMYTLGYSFRPWTGDKSIADGSSILQYLRDTAREYGVDERIRYGHRVRAASWSTADACWTVRIERDGGDTIEMRASFLMLCCGYYDYDAGYTPEFVGRDQFRGRFVHPQHWPDDLDCTGKRVVVIGSGATAVTLVPELAKRAAHVTMLQRSPSYILTMPSVDVIAGWLRRWTPRAFAHAATRWKNVLMSTYIASLSRRKPQFVKRLLLGWVTRQLAPGYDVATHFTPSYNPWEQRLCLVPDGDLFKSIRSGRASLVTDRIERFTGDGLKLESGKDLQADIVVCATGLRMTLLRGMAFSVDGRALETSQLVNYKGVMFCGVPNLVFVMGYTRASWTLKADLASVFLCRLLKHMRRAGTRACVPRSDASMKTEPWVDLSSGYFQRALDQLPKQGDKKPWKLSRNYLGDVMTLRFGAIDDGVLRFSQ